MKRIVTNLILLIDMGRTFRRDDDHNFGRTKNKNLRAKKNKPGKVKKSFTDRNYNELESYEDRYDDGGFEKFTYGKRKGK